MRIDDKNGGANPLTQTNGTSSTDRTARGGGNTGSTSRSGSDSVQISGFAAQLSKTLEAGSSSRSQRIGEIAQAVRSGTYQVDAGAISRALVDHAISGGKGGWVS